MGTTGAGWFVVKGDIPRFAFCVVLYCKHDVDACDAFYLAMDGDEWRQMEIKAEARVTILLLCYYTLYYTTACYTTAYYTKAY